MQTTKMNTQSKKRGKNANRKTVVSDIAGQEARDAARAEIPEEAPIESQKTADEECPFIDQPTVHPETDVRLLDLNKIINSTYSPRKNFREETLLELAESIKQSGVLQPICVRPRDEGFEIVSHPATLDSHMHSFPWEQMMDAAVAMGYRSHQATTCGLHVHISRDAFGQTEQAQEAAIARLLFFVEKHWNELLKFSRQTNRQLERWAARYGYKDTPKEMMDHAKSYHYGRYTCVNLTNEDTVEIRIFRGTLKYNTLAATIQLTDRLCDVVTCLNDEELRALSWSDFIAGVTEPELIQYLKERRLYLNEPVESEVEL